MEITPIFDAIRERNWPLVTGLIVLVIVAAWKRTDFSDAVPERLRWLVPLVVGMLTGGAEAAISGADWTTIVERGITVGLVGSGFWGWIQSAKGDSKPGSGSSASAGMLLFLFTVTCCAGPAPQLTPKQAAAIQTTASIASLMLIEHDADMSRATELLAEIAAAADERPVNVDGILEPAQELLEIVERVVVANLRAGKEIPAYAREAILSLRIILVGLTQ